MGEQPKTRKQVREAQRRTSSTSPLLIGGLILLLVVAAGWVGKTLFLDGDTTSTSADAPVASPTPTSAVTSSEATPSETTTSADPLAASIASCRESWQLRSAARAAAATSLGEWNAHIAIMNRLEAGQITLATAKAQWPATTRNAPANITAFRKADAALAASNASCAVPPAATTGAEADALRACAASEKVVDGILVQARVAIKPWEVHLSEQSHFQAGEVTPAIAEAKWRVKWQEGQKTLPGYVTAARAGASATCELPA